MNNTARSGSESNHYQAALISGASRGIGQAIAERLAQLGIAVFLMGRDGEALRTVAERCVDLGGQAQWLAGDLLDRTYVDEAISLASDAFGSIDVLINNAGTTSNSQVQSVDLDTWRSVFDLNFDTVVYLCRQLLPSMIENQRGAVINLSSISGRTTAGNNALYSSSKHALNGFSGCLYEDVRDYGIKVSAIMPGFVETDLTARLNRASENMLMPSDVAHAVEFVLGASARCCPTEIVLRPQLRP